LVPLATSAYKKHLLYRHFNLGLSAKRASVAEGRQLAKILFLTGLLREFFDVFAGMAAPRRLARQ